MKNGNEQLPENAGTEGWRHEFLEGAEDAMPIVMAAAPFGALFGAAAAAQGLPGFEIILASLTIYAGASQFVFLELYGLSVPAWSVVLAVFAVNFRHILYGASIGRKMGAFRPLSKYTAFFFLTDPQWAASEVRSDGPGLRPAYYFGFVVPLYSLWMAGTVIGVWFGSLIKNPTAFGFDMLLPIYFLAILMGFRKRVNWLPIVLVSGISSSVLSVTIGPPWHISLGGLIGLIVAAFLPLPKGKEERGDGEDG